MGAGDLRRRIGASLARAAAGALVALAGRLLSEGSNQLPGLQLLDPARGFAFLSGLLFGFAGVVGHGLGSAVLYFLRAPTFIASYHLGAGAVLGLAAWAARRWRPELGRGVPDLRAYAALLAAAVVGGLPAAVLLARAVPGAGSLRSVWFWWGALVASVMVLVPPLAIWLAPLRERWGARGAGGAAGRRAAAGAPWRRAAAGRALGGWAGPVLAALAVSLIAALVGRVAPAGDRWLQLLYVAPILWAARRHGLRGGLLLASLVSLSYLVVSPVDRGSLANFHANAVAQHAGLLMFSLFGALWGRARDQELRLLDELTAANLRLRGDLERVVRALRGAIEAKDSYTEGHLARVAAFSQEVGQRLGLAGDELELLAMASVLHDVGKIGVPEPILGKPGPLAPAEQEVMQRHPKIGAGILAEIEGLEEAAPLVLYHQERYDGLRQGAHPGYPAGLKGEEIPLGARVIAVVDAFDAMTSDRPYRKRLGHEEARAVLRHERGRQFDPRVVDVFLAVLDEQPWGAGGG
jgi:HD-GYP domain-containing protein (c-di-GMP phosphodiesterase class II)